MSETHRRALGPKVMREAARTMTDAEHDEYLVLVDAMHLARKSVEIVDDRRIALTKKMRDTMGDDTQELSSELKKLIATYRDGQLATARYVRSVDLMKAFWGRFLENHRADLRYIKSFEKLLKTLANEVKIWQEIHEDCADQITSLTWAREEVLKPLLVKEKPRPANVETIRPIQHVAPECVACGKPGVATDDEGQWWCKPHAYMKMLLTGQSPDDEEGWVTVSPTDEDPTDE